jgi:hypothetical protein
MTLKEKTMMTRVNFLIAASILNLSAVGQQRIHTASVTPVEHTGLYRIRISAEWRSSMSRDFHDVRLLDSNGTEIPFVVASEPVMRPESGFEEYPVISQKHKKTFTEIIVENTMRNKISNITFDFNNSDASKYCAVEGSDDMQRWYSVSAMQELSLGYNRDQTHTYKSIYFPLSSYRYFRLLIEDWTAEPLKLNKAGYYKSSVVAGHLDTIRILYTITKNNDKKTRITIHPENNIIERIDLEITAPRLYSRYAKLVTEKEKKRRHHLPEKYYENLGEFELRSDRPLHIETNGINEKDLILEIENKDNPPLEIKTISFLQLRAYLIADLISGKRYTLNWGDRNLKYPDYDLGEFITMVPQLLPETSMGEVKILVNEKKSAPEYRQRSFFESRTFMWLCIFTGAVIVGYFSFVLLRDMSRKQN